MNAPRVSILIPNFNNGCESSADGRFDMLGTLLRSLHDTLRDDPTPVEIIIADDGSTDDSLQTAQQWAERTWQQGGGDKPRPFCRLIELQHSGVLSAVANRLMREAVGDIMVRLDGDVELLTTNWATLLIDAFAAAPPRLGIIGPKQLTADGFVHAAGDWILHPRGYHHVGQGTPRAAITRAIEVDHVMGCFYCQQRAVWEQIGPYDETILRGQTIDYGLRARLHGWSCMSIPTIEFVHHHAARARRKNHADTETAIVQTLDRFREKWGFDRVAPDLDVVAERYRGTPLLWNARVFGPMHSADGGLNTMQHDIPVERTRWHRFAHDTAVQSAMTNQIGLINDALQRVMPKRSSPARIVQIGCHEGLLCHLLAQHGDRVIGISDDAALLKIGQQMIERAKYPGDSPKLLHDPMHRSDAIKAASADLVLLVDVVETHPNPVGLFNQVHRLLRAGGSMLIITPERRTPLDADVDRMHLYREHELVSQMYGTGLFTIDAAWQPNVSGTLVKLCQNRMAAKCATAPSDAQHDAARDAAPVATAV